VGRLIYTAITSLDGYVADADGNFDWSVPDDEVHRFVNDLERPIGTQLYGRRMYEVLVAWETMDTTDESDTMQDFARIWRSADKIVFSSTLAHVSSARTRIERSFDPAMVAALKSSASTDVGIGGPHLAAHSLRAGLLDDLHQLISPVVVGGGNSWLPDDVRVGLELVDQRRFINGVVHLHYRVRD